MAKEDLYYPHPLIQDVLWWTLYKAEGLLVGSSLRRKAVAECMRHIHYEVRLEQGFGMDSAWRLGSTARTARPLWTPALCI